MELNGEMVPNVSRAGRTTKRTEHGYSHLQACRLPSMDKLAPKTWTWCGSETQTVGCFLRGKVGPSRWVRSPVQCLINVARTSSDKNIETAQ